MIKSRKLLLVLCIALLTSISLLAFPVEAASEDFINEYIKRYYLHEVDNGELENKDPAEIFDAYGDNHSIYYSPSQFNQFMQNMEDSFEGIGITITRKNDYPVVVETLPATPAEKAGIQAEDIILSVNGVSMEKMPIDMVVSMIRGEAGTVLTLRVSRNGALMNIPVTRGSIKLQSTLVKQLDEDTYEISIRQFTEETGKELKEKISHLKDGEPKDFIIDLRDNTGGYLNSSVETAEIFAPAGNIVTLEGRNGIVEKYDGKGPFVPVNNIVVLINGYSASGSEIVTGALRDRADALLVGTTTYGKGSVQNMFQLPDGGVLRLTTAHYKTPSGYAIDGVGLEPDYYVEGVEEQWDKALELLSPRVRDPLADKYGILTDGVQEIIFMPDTGEVLYQRMPMEDLDVSPFVYEGLTYTPLRFYAETFGYDVSWNEEERAVTVKRKDFEMIFVLGEDKALVDGREILFDYSLKNRNGRIYFPLRTIIQLLGGELEWLEDERSVIIRNE